MEDLSKERMDRLLAYCRIQEPTQEERCTVEALYSSAVGYLDQAGVSEPLADTPRRAQYDLCIDYLVLDAFDVRAATITGAAVTENPAFRRLLNQLKLTEASEPSCTAG